MVSSVKYHFSLPYLPSSSTVNQLPHQSTPIRTRTTLLLQRRRLQLPLTKVVTPLVVVRDLAAPLAALVIGAPHSEVQDVRRLPGALLMRPLYVY
jgi:hypothetical protein